MKPSTSRRPTTSSAPPPLVDPTALTSRTARGSASLQAYVDALSKKSSDGSSGSASARRAAPPSARTSGPLLAPLQTKRAADKKTVRSPTLSRANSNSVSKATSRSVSRATSITSIGAGSSVAASEEAPSSTPGSTHHRQANSNGSNGGSASVFTFPRPDASTIEIDDPNLPPYTVDRSLAAATEAVISKHGGVATDTSTGSEVDSLGGGDSANGTAFSSQSKDQQRTSMRPWYVNIQEKASSASGRAHRRSRALQEQTSRTRAWRHQVREIVDTSESQFEKSGAAELSDLRGLHTNLVKAQELNELRLECIAATFDLSTRGALKKQRQMTFVATDHTNLRSITDEKSRMFDEMCVRSSARRERVKEHFCASWEVIHFVGARIHDQTRGMLAQMNKHATTHLARLRAQIPGHIAKQHAMQISLQDMAAASPTPAAAPATNTNDTPPTGTNRATHTTKAAPSVFATTPGIGVSSTPVSVEAPSDFTFAPPGPGDSDNAISLRLPTSVAARPPHESGIDYATGAFEARLARHVQVHGGGGVGSRRGAGDSRGRAASSGTDRNYTTSRYDLALVHASHTIAHIGAPALNPSWVTLCCSAGPRLLPRSPDQLTSAPGFALLYDELIHDLATLRHRTHIVDLLAAALDNYKRVAQVNTDQAVWAARHPDTAVLNAFYAAPSSTVGSGHASPLMGKKTMATRTNAMVRTGASVAVPAPDGGADADAPDEESGEVPVATSGAIVPPPPRDLETRIRDLVLDLECCGFEQELEPFRARPTNRPGTTATPASTTAAAATTAATSSTAGTTTTSILEDDSLPALQKLARALLERFAARSRFYARFYLEVHAPSAKTTWFAGFVLGPMPDNANANEGETNTDTKAATAAADDATAIPAPTPISTMLDEPLNVLEVDLYSTRQHTLALHSDGSTFMRGHSKRVLRPLTDATVVGFVVDLLRGSIAFTVDGVAAPTPLFGVGAGIYSPAEQREQATWIRSQRLRPCFGVMGPKAKVPHGARTNFRDGERERARLAMGLDAAGNPLGGTRPTRARHALTAHSALASQANAETDTATSTGSPFVRDEDAPLDVGHGVSSGAAVGSASAAAESLAAQAGDGLIGWVVPKLSINLGEFEFLYLPRGRNLGLATKTTHKEDGIATPNANDISDTIATDGNAWSPSEEGGVASDDAPPVGSGLNFGLGSCLAMNTHEAPAHDSAGESDRALVHAFTAYRTARQTRQAAQQAARDKANATGAATAPDVKSTTAAPVDPLATLDVSEYRHRHSHAALAQLDALRQEFLSRPSASDLAKSAEEEKRVFFAKLAPTQLVSWSHFPPQSIRVQQAVLKVQRIARRFLGFRARRALWDRLSAFAVLIQRCFRRFRARRNLRLAAAIAPIQRLWRGFKARRMVRLLRKYNLTYDAANRAAVRIQSFTRMLLERKKVLVLAMVVQQKIEQIKGLVIFVQRMVRRKLENRAFMANKTMLSSVLIFQSRIRGIRLRRMLAAIDPGAARQLKVIAVSVTEKQRRWSAASLLQRVYRGYVARKFVRSKRNVIERDCARLRDCWRAYQLRQRIDRAFRGYEAEHLKAFMQAIGYVGQETTHNTTSAAR